MDQLEDMILGGAQVSAADVAAWRRRVIQRKEEEKEDEEEEKAAEDFLRSFFLSNGAHCAENRRVSPVQFLVMDVFELMQRRPE